jgi:hypothetical protein
MFLMIEQAASDAAKRQRNAVSNRFAHNPKGEFRTRRFFCFFFRNPLKSPDSAKGIQGNARIFPCFYLDLLGLKSP